MTFHYPPKSYLTPQPLHLCLRVLFRYHDWLAPFLWRSMIAGRGSVNRWTGVEISTIEQEMWESLGKRYYRANCSKWCKLRHPRMSEACRRGPLAEPDDCAGLGRSLCVCPRPRTGTECADFYKHCKIHARHRLHTWCACVDKSHTQTGLFDAWDGGPLPEAGSLAGDGSNSSVYLHRE